MLRFRHLLEKHDLTRAVFATVNLHLAQQGLMLKEGTVVDATIISAPSSTKNKEGKRDPDMHQTKKGNQWYFGMKAHIGVDAESGLVHSLEGTAANTNDVTQTHKLLHGEEQHAFGDAGYQGVEKREENRNSSVEWHVVLRPGKRKALPKLVEKTKAGVRARLEHPFHIIKNLFGLKKTRYRGLTKYVAQLFTLSGLANLVKVGRKLNRQNRVIALGSTQNHFVSCGIFKI